MYISYVCVQTCVSLLVCSDNLISPCGEGEAHAEQLC